MLFDICMYLHASAVVINLPSISLYFFCCHILSIGQIWRVILYVICL
nr:MAG TPA: hypothetical protein [Caudoviricetes sp.]